ANGKCPSQSQNGWRKSPWSTSLGLWEWTTPRSKGCSALCQRTVWTPLMRDWSGYLVYDAGVMPVTASKANQHPRSRVNCGQAYRCEIVANAQAPPSLPDTGPPRHPVQPSRQCNVRRCRPQPLTDLMPGILRPTNPSQRYRECDRL